MDNDPPECNLSKEEEELRNKTIEEIENYFNEKIFEKQNFDDLKSADYTKEKNGFHIKFSDELTKKFTVKLDNKTLRFSQLDFIFTTDNKFFYITEVFVYDIIIAEKECGTRTIMFKTNYDKNNSLKGDLDIYNNIKGTLIKIKSAFKESKSSSNKSPKKGSYMDVADDEPTSGGKKRHRKRTRKTRKTRRKTRRRNKKRKTYRKY